MKLRKLTVMSSLLLLLCLGTAAQAATVFESTGFETGAGLFDSGSITLLEGDYTLSLTAFTFGVAGPFIFGIASDTEAFQISLPSFGADSVAFSTLGGVFEFLVGGNAGEGTIYAASIESVAPVPLPPAVGLLGAAMVAMATINRRRT